MYLKTTAVFGNTTWTKGHELCIKCDLSLFLSFIAGIKFLRATPRDEILLGILILEPYISFCVCVKN
jgi:hypothetical protein